MTELTLTNLNSLSTPYSIYVCNVYGTSCVLIATSSTIIPPSVTFSLPNLFDTAPVVGVKVVENNGCERFKILYCSSDEYKQFMNIEEFLLMTGDPYQFQNQ